MGRLLLAVTAALVLVCGACQVRIETDVEARRDGSGVIEVAVGLDRDALAEVPDLAEQLEVDDLRRAGWRVVGPRRERDGLTWIRARFAFETPTGARRALSRLNGPTGPFRGFTLTRQGSPFRARVHLEGTVDLSTGLEGFADAELARRLGAANPAVDTATLERRFGFDLARALRVRVSARLPGLTRTWQPRVGNEPFRFNVSSTTWDPRALGLGGVGALALVLALTLLVRRHRPEADAGRPADPGVSQPPRRVVP